MDFRRPLIVQGSQRRGGPAWQRFGRGFLLALLMVLAHQGMLLIALGHYEHAGSASRQDTQHPGSGACELCGALAHVGAAAAPVVFATVLLAGLAFAWPRAPRLAPAASGRPALRNRGPPAGF